MADSTHISWCDMTYNHWEGCTKVSPGCDNCYAEARNIRFNQGGNWGPGAPRRLMSEATRQNPIKWNKKAGEGLFVECHFCRKREFRGRYKLFEKTILDRCSNPDCLSLQESETVRVRPRVFCSSLSDVFDNEVPIEWLVDLLDTIRVCPSLDFLMLTKRIGNFNKRMSEARSFLFSDETGHSELYEWVDNWINGKPPANVWLCITVVNQQEADRDISKLLEIPARVRGLSMEPLLEAVSLLDHPPFNRAPIPSEIQAQLRAIWPNGLPENSLNAQLDKIKIDWVIAGGESGSNARPMNPDWARSLRDQCVAAGVKFHFKQFGEWAPSEQPAHPENADYKIHSGKGFLFDDGQWVDRIGKTKAGRTLDGRTWDQFPFPEVKL